MAYDKVATDKRRIQSDSGNVMKVDDLGMIAADSEHHWRESFDELYNVNYLASVAPASSITIVIAIPYDGNYPHGNMCITTSQAANYTFILTSIGYAVYSALTVGAGRGEYLYPFNANRGLNYTRCTTEFYTGDTHLDGSWLCKTLVQGISGSQFTMTSEMQLCSWLLDVGRVYKLDITNSSAVTAYMVFNYAFHEHDAIESSVTDSTDGEDNTEYAGHLGHV